MYNPCRGGVRGGADQFTWESVKNDKHRENYLGHSLKAPVGRWQKGKDLSWYAKERKDGEGEDKSKKMEFAAIKRAEEEAMLIALGHNVVKKESQGLSKEEMREALKRNAGQKDEYDVERVDGVGASGSSKRLALLSNSGMNFKAPQEGVAFEGYKKVEKKNNGSSRNKRDNLEKDHSKKSKKQKKEKKQKKHCRYSSDSDSSKHTLKHKKGYEDIKKSNIKKHESHHKNSSDSDSSKYISELKRKHRRKDSDSDDAESHSKLKSRKKLKHKEKRYSSGDSEKCQSSKIKHSKKKKRDGHSVNIKRHRHNSSGSDS